MVLERQRADLHGEEAVREALGIRRNRDRLAGRARTLLIVTHDEDFAGQVATRKLVMQEGRLVPSVG